MNDYRSLSEIRSHLQSGQISLPELVEHYLQNIEKSRELNIFLEVFTDEVRQNAKAIQSRIDSGTAGKLAGMVLAVKDNICIKGHKVSAASKMLKDFESLFSATAIERLLAEDVLIIGRVNCDEFAMGSSNENSAFGPVSNPLDPAKVPGGSSGGSAAAVAANCCLAALGSDTGGSIRQPAALCGVVGLKPTYGRISRHGLIAFGSSFDQIGPLCHSVSDAALLLQCMAGSDAFDATAATTPVPEYLPSEQNSGAKYKIGFISECLKSESLDPEIRQNMYSLIDKLKADGHELVEIEMKELDYMVPVYYVLTTAEASSNLSRYDGIHFGYRSEQVEGIEQTYVRSRSEGFGKEVKRRIMLGTFVLSAGYYDAYYAKGQKVRRLIKEKTDRLLSKVDFLLSPTTPTTAFEHGKKAQDPIAMYLEDVFTVHANLAGTPAISLPLATHSNKMPIGVQVMAARFAEQSLLQFAEELLTAYRV